jgi:hypothetical protein
VQELDKPLEKLAGTQEDLHKFIGLNRLSYKEDQEACMVEIKQTQEMLEEAKEKHNDVAKMYKLLRKILSSDPQIQREGSDLLGDARV